jgi:hypothetical protein
MHKSKIFDHSFDAAFTRRLDEWRAGGPELSEAEAERYLQEADPDLITTNNFIMAQLTPEEERDFKARLINDAAFFEKVWPMVHSAAVMRDEHGEGRAAIPIYPPHRRRSMPLRAAAFAAACLVAVILGGGSLARLHVVRAQEAVADRREGRADVGNAFFRSGYSTGAHESHVYPLNEGQITLRPNSRLTNSPFAPKIGNRTLDGGARLSLPRKVPADSVNIRTATAYVGFKRGYFDITSVPGSGRTTVVVYEGLAEVRPLAPERPFTPVTARHRAVIGRDGSVVVDSIGDTPAPPKDLITRIRGG